MKSTTTRKNNNGHYYKKLDNLECGRFYVILFLCKKIYRRRYFINNISNIDIV